MNESTLRIQVPTWLLLVFLTTFNACERGNPFGRGDDTIRRSSRIHLLPSEVQRLPVESCIESVTDSASLRIVGTVLPNEALGIDQDEISPTDWIPTRLTDVASFPTGLAVIDGGEATVTVFSSDLTERRTWSRRGQGPGELQHPVAIAPTPTGDTLWVLDDGSLKLVAFDLEGNYLTAIQLPVRSGPPIDLAIDSEGRFFLAYAVAHDGVVQNPDHFGLVVAVHNPDGSPSHDLVRVQPEDLQPPRFVLPRVSDVRLAAFGDQVAVLYPEAGVTDIYRNDVLQTTVRVCMTRKLEDAYDLQREVVAEKNIQAQIAIHLITDVQIGSDGTISVVSGIKDKDMRYHVDKFTADGQPTGSIVYRAQGTTIPFELRFGRTSNELTGFEGRGRILAFDLETR